MQSTSQPLNTPYFRTFPSIPNAIPLIQLRPKRITYNLLNMFFAAGNSDSDESSQDNRIKVVDQEKNRIRNMAHHLQSDSEEEDRVVRTEKEKRWESFKKICTIIKNKSNNNDFTEILNQFEQLSKELKRSQKLIKQHGYPRFLMSTIVNLIEFVNTFTKKKDLNATNGKNYAKLKDRLKKFEREITADIEKFKAQKKDQPAEDDEEMPSEDEEEEEEEEEDDESDDDTSPLNSDDPMIRRRYWLKKEPKKKAEEEKETKKKVEEESEKEEEKVVDNKGQTRKANVVAERKKQTSFTSEQAVKKLRQIAKTFGKQVNSQDREDSLDAIQRILSTAKTDSQRLSLLMIQVPYRIESSRSQHLPAFRRKDWVLIYNKLKEMYRLIQESEEDDLLDTVDTYQEGDQYYSSTAILNAMKSFFITLEDELRKAFIFTDFNDINYSMLLQDLLDLIEFTYGLFKMFNAREGFEDAACEAAFRLIENIYYMGPETFSKIRQQSSEQSKTNPQFLQLQKPDRFGYLVEVILANSKNDTSRTKTILYDVYNHSINNRERGKDLLLLTDVIQRAANSVDYFTQVTFNRAIVQVGLLAFRNGNMYEVQGALSELCSYGRTKELLGQGFNKPQEKESLRNKVLPYHLHINVDMVESVELIAAMVLEIPYTLEDGGRITSKTLKKVYEHYERSHFIAEPLNSRDLIYSASKELQRANWKECFERLMQLSMWRKMKDSDTCKTNLLLRIKEQSLKCFLISNEQAFTTISLANLAARFELGDSAVQTAVNKMIYNNELTGSITEGFIKLYHHQVNRTEKILASVYDQARKLTEANERDFDERLGNYVAAAEQDEPSKQMRSKKRNPMHEKYKSTYIKKNPKKK